ncbi:MAG: nucleoside triphosphate pyrophosphatase [Candidatus Margulisiibacteriota bacterium]
MTLFLASASPRRVDLLRQAGIAFEQIPNLLLEEALPKVSADIRADLRRLAKQKAWASKADYQGLVLGVDTVVVLGKRILGKPETMDDAKAMLASLSGETHRVISAFCLLDTTSGKSVSRTETTTVTFKMLSPTDIDWYCTTFNPLDKAGSYGLQEVGNRFVARVSGSLDTVIGLPTKTLYPILKKRGIMVR